MDTRGTNAMQRGGWIVSQAISQCKLYNKRLCGCLAGSLGTAIMVITIDWVDGNIGQMHERLRRNAGQVVTVSDSVVSAVGNVVGGNLVNIIILLITFTTIYQVPFTTLMYVCLS